MPRSSMTPGEATMPTPVSAGAGGSQTIPFSSRSSSRTSSYSWSGSALGPISRSRANQPVPVVSQYRSISPASWASRVVWVSPRFRSSVTSAPAATSVSVAIQPRRRSTGRDWLPTAMGRPSISSSTSVDQVSASAGRAGSASGTSDAHPASSPATSSIPTTDGAPQPLSS